MRIVGCFLLLMGTVFAQDGPVASWPFDNSAGGDTIRGFHKFVPGVSGQALHLDGQTTHVIRASDRAPRLGRAFTIEAWVALQTYPWTWCAIVNQEQEMKRGYFFGIDPEGRFGLHLAVDGKWQESKSDVKLPLYTWNHIAATYDADSGIRLYWNGRPAGMLAVRGTPDYATGADLLIGRNETARGLSEEVRVVAKVAFSFEGLIDELKIHDRAAAPQEKRAAGAAPLAPPVLPSGPKGPGRFGAYYTRLRYHEDWENLWRVGDAADIVVRFDDTPNRLVFWRGTSYIPAWVTENGIWYTNEFWETQAEGMDTSAEPMADKQARFSHVRILESNDARVVIHWRYAPVSVNYDLVYVDELTGWGDWVDEYYTVYPDGSCVRKIHVSSSSPHVVPGKGTGTGGFRQFHEAIIINPPGTRPEDNIHPEALTVANMKGESHTYSWAKDAPGGPPHFDEETLTLMHRISDLDTASHKWLNEPADGNILRVNLKARYSPYVIVSPKHVAIDCYDGEIIRERSMFPWWNHWPVSQQIRSNGRWAVAPDRVSHSSLAHIQSWQPLEDTGTGITMAMLNGLSDKQADALVPLAKSWLAPPKVIASAGFKSRGYDPGERAFVLEGVGTRPLELRFDATADSPLVNPALIVRNWGPRAVTAKLDGRALAVGRELRVGKIENLEGTDLVIWIRGERTKPAVLQVAPLP